MFIGGLSWQTSPGKSVFEEETKKVFSYLMVNGYKLFIVSLNNKKEFL